MEEIYCFAGNPLDRASERRRDTAWIATLLGDPAARVLPLSELRPLIRKSDTTELDWQPVAPWREAIGRGATLIFLGLGGTLEEAVRREVHEESGIHVGRVKYLACQPWPFPSSLMMGFLCEALSEEITVDPEELDEARWFHRDEIRAMVVHAANGLDDPTQVSVPGPVAIAHHICRRWSNGLDSL